jgi:hypothetical protein
MDRSRRRSLLTACLIVFLGAAVWSAALTTDETRDHTTRTLGLGGLVLFSILSGGTVAQFLKSRPKATTPADTAPLAR